MVSETDKEAALVKQLKNLCIRHQKLKNKWKERNPKKTAKILHKLGQLYRERSLVQSETSMGRKIQSIQSAACLNCALVRDRTESCENDLKSLCSGILKAAVAKKQEFDLVAYACSLKSEVKKWRVETDAILSKLSPIQRGTLSEEKQQLEKKKIDAIEFLQDKITEKYKAFMRDVALQTIDILGGFPCQWALTGMGSMARKEITPYSDFENIIILEEGVQMRKDYEKILECVRWFAVIFQIILINMRETILPSVAISSLNDYTALKSENKDWFFDAHTPRGISFDGMMPHACKSPLGRQQILENKPWKTELIKPISEMAEYLSKEENLKNGYHLADILANTCFVAGDAEVHKEFEKTVEKKLKDDDNHAKAETAKTIKDDMDSFSTKFGIADAIDSNSYNVKQFVYRSTTIFVVGLAKLHNIKFCSCFEAVRNLQNHKLISEIFSQKLQYAIAIACEIRLRAYFQKRRQDDNIDSLFDDKASSTLAESIGMQSCYDYFEIAYSLQYDVIVHLKLSRRYMYYHPVTMCVAICSLLNLDKQMIAAWKYVMNYPILCHQPPEETNVSNMAESSEGNEKKILGSWYSQMQDFNLRVEKTREIKSQPLTIKVSEKIKMLMCFGEYLLNKKLYGESQCCYKIAALLADKDPEEIYPFQKSFCLFSIGKCFCGQENYEIAVEKIEEALKLCQQLPQSQKPVDHFEGNCHQELGLCYFHLCKHEDAAAQFETALKYYMQCSPNTLQDIKFCLLYVSICFQNLNMHLKAEDKLDEYVEIVSAEKTYLTESSSLSDHEKYLRNKATGYQQIALFHIDYLHYSTALSYSKQSLAICKDCQDVSTELQQQIMKLYRIRGRSYQGIFNFKQAAKYYRKAIKMHVEIPANAVGKPMLVKQKADILLNCAYCLKQNSRFDDANKYTMEALKIFYQLLKQNAKNVALWKDIGVCYWYLQNETAARVFFLKYVCLLRQQALGSEKNRKELAFALMYIGKCWNNKKNKIKAMEYFLEALKMFSKLPKNPKRDLEIAFMHAYIGDLHAKKSASNEALQSLSKAQMLLEVLPQMSVKVKLLNAWIHKINGYYYKKAKDFVNAAQRFEKSAEIWSLLPYTLKNQKEKANMMKEAGFCSKNNADFKKAIQYFEKSIEAFEKIPDEQHQKLQIVIIRKNLGFCFQRLQIPSEAIEYFLLALKALRSFPQNEDNDREIAIISEQLAISYDCLCLPGKSKIASSYAQKAINAYERLSKPMKYQHKIKSLKNTYPFCRVAAAKAPVQRQL